MICTEIVIPLPGGFVVLVGFPHLCVLPLVSSSSCEKQLHSKKKMKGVDRLRIFSFTCL